MTASEYNVKLITLQSHRGALVKTAFFGVCFSDNVNVMAKDQKKKKKKRQSDLNYYESKQSECVSNCRMK